MSAPSPKRRRLFAALIVGLSSAPLLAQPAPTTNPVDIEQAVRQLGDDRFNVRRRAAEIVFLAGPAIIPRLHDLSAASPDPEVRAQAKHILDEFAIGLLPETPPDVLENARRYLTTDNVDKLVILNQLSRRGGFGYVVILGLNLFEPTDSPAKNKMAELSRDAGSEIVRSASELIAADRAESAERLLTFGARAGEASCARALAAFLGDPRRVEATIDGWEGEGRGDLDVARRQAVPIAMLYRALGRLDKAIEWAEPVDGDVAMKLAVEASDWPRVARLAEAVATPSDATLGLLASARRLSGDEPGFRAAIERLRDESSDTRAWATPMIALALNDDVTAGLAAAAPPAEAVPRVVDLLVVAGRYAEARKLIGDTTAAAAGAEEGNGNADPIALGAMGAMLELQTGHTGEAVAAVEKLAKDAQARPGFGPFLAVAQCEAQLCRLDERWESRRRAHALAALMAAHTVDQRCAAMRCALPHADAAQAADWWQWLSEPGSKRPPVDRLNLVASIVYQEIKPADLARLAVPLLAARPAEPGDPHGRRAVLSDLAAAYAGIGGARAAQDCGDRLVTVYELSSNWDKAAWAAVHFHLWQRAADDLAHLEDVPSKAWLRGWAMAQGGDAQAGERLMAGASRRALGEADAESLAYTVRAVGARPEVVHEAFERLLHVAAPGSQAYAGACGVLAAEAVKQQRWAEAARYVQLYALLPFYSQGRVDLDRACIDLPHLVHVYQARAALDRGDDAEALRQVRLMLAIRPFESRGILDLITAARATRPAAADQILHLAERPLLDALAAYPDHAGAHNDLAWLYARGGGNLDEAEAHAERALALQPRNEHVLDTLAEISFRRGDKAKALEWLTRCEAVDPHDPTVRQRRAAFEADHTDAPAASEPPLLPYDSGGRGADE